MRKIYVVLGTCRQTNHSWIVGVYTSKKKASIYLSVAKNAIGEKNTFEIITEILI